MIGLKSLIPAIAIGITCCGNVHASWLTLRTTGGCLVHVWDDFYTKEDLKAEWSGACISNKPINGSGTLRLSAPAFWWQQQGKFINGIPVGRIKLRNEQFPGSDTILEYVGGCTDHDAEKGCQPRETSKQSVASPPAGSYQWHEYKTPQGCSYYEWSSKRTWNQVEWNGVCSVGEPINGRGSVTLSGIVNMKVFGNLSNGRFDGKMQVAILPSTDTATHDFTGGCEKRNGSYENGCAPQSGAGGKNNDRTNSNNIANSRPNAETDSTPEPSDSQPVMNCVVVSRPEGDNWASMYNKCTFYITVDWCYVGAECGASGGGNLGNIAPKQTRKASTFISEARKYELRYSACSGRDKTIVRDGPQRYFCK